MQFQSPLHPVRRNIASGMTTLDSFTTDTRNGVGATPYNRPKPLPDQRLLFGLVVLPPGMRFFSSANLRRLWLRYNIWLLLTILAIGGGIVAFLNEYLIGWLTHFHQKTINNNKFSEPVKFVLWTVFTIGCVVLSCICVALSDSHAAEGTPLHLFPFLGLHSPQNLIPRVISSPLFYFAP